MIRRFLQWLGFFERQNHLSAELEPTVAAIVGLEAFKTEYGSDYTTRRLKSAKSPWRASILDFIS